MSKWKDILVAPETPILKVIETIDASSQQIAMVVDVNGCLVGTVTDGDVRRGLLRGIGLGAAISEIMFREPTVARLNDSRDLILSIMKAKELRHIPILDEVGRVVGMEVLDELVRQQARSNRVVLMAGGFGSRLHPLTKETPKPLIQVGNRPILETILENFIEYGFRNFSLSVNYKAEMVKTYFGDGSRWGVNIDYLQEELPLGTAGPLGLLSEYPSDPVLVMNGDLLTKVNFQQLLDFHQAHRAQATMCVREYESQVPFGVVHLDHHRLLEIEEKPVQRFFVSAGIYVLEPKILNFITPGTRLDMPELFKMVIAKGLETAAFPIREYWLDIGRMDDLEKAKGEYDEVFR